MVNNINDLKNQIVQKNMMLNAIKLDDNAKTEDVKAVKYELDELLYQYYKLLRCS